LILFCATDDALFSEMTVPVSIEYGLVFVEGFCES